MNIRPPTTRGGPSWPLLTPVEKVKETWSCLTFWVLISDSSLYRVPAVFFAGMGQSASSRETAKRGRPVSFFRPAAGYGTSTAKVSKQLPESSIAIRKNAFSDLKWAECSRAAGKTVEDVLCSCGGYEWGTTTASAAFGVKEGEMPMSLRHDLRVFREPGFYVSAVFAVVFLGGLLVFAGLTAP